MAEYTAAVTVDLAAAALFAWVADTASLPAYVPAVAEAAFVGGDHLLVTFIDGSACAAWLRIYRDSRQLAWGTDDGRYRGELHVVPRLDSEGSLVTVTVRADALGEAELAAATSACLAAAADAARAQSRPLTNPAR